MKKTIITLCILALVGCTKEQQLTSVSFNLQGVESGAITKADLAAQIGALLPASPYLSLTIQSKTKAAKQL